MLYPHLDEETHVRSWLTIDDILPEQLDSWNHRFHTAALSEYGDNLIGFTSDPSFELLVQVARENLQDLSCYIPVPFFLILVDCSGVARHIQGPDNVLATLQGENIGIGTRFSMESFGINAISVAMETKMLVLLRGPEHTPKFFSQWTCICSPIQIDNEVWGYLDLSFSDKVVENFATALVSTITRNMAWSFKQKHPKIDKHTFLNKCDAYKLTNREKEVAFLWYYSMTRSQIAKTLHLSEDTVKTHIRNISCKANVRGRSCFREKFL
ncbi:transcriptional regulator of acetoin/glycerol metabolism [Paenibacillus phyllosphaerae]|uniref:Transcriptional regulator of acetoin/glycerol metabolism n=1 Tax=Paenibacillus phyllosphaerae TaxID=274593 RepID=A0A7W5B4K6_9BACL|nr:LuxR C-terminal-related transcriptional regulator [Paenibacillus phyllosphaerae]MBB3114054.1 transcriptional regulator of acetoin/glycerol metabolism [Paenibacillus phyllosphaerae]